MNSFIGDGELPGETVNRLIIVRKNFAAFLLGHKWVDDEIAVEEDIWVRHFRKNK